MKKVWFIKVDGKEIGPFSKKELKFNSRITPDTLVRRHNWTKWIPIKKVEELKEIFEDENKNDDDDDETSFDKKKISDVLTMSLEPKHIFWWFLLIISLVLYILFHVYD